MEKCCTSARDANGKSISDKEYLKMISFCDQAIEKDPNGVDSVLALLIRCNLHENKKHAKAAMVCFNHLNVVLNENSEVEKKWRQMLDEIREMKEKQIGSQSETPHYLPPMPKIQDPLSANNEEIKKTLMSLFAEKFPELQKVDTLRKEIKADEEHFANNDLLNKNRIIFYTKMRSSLSHKFTAMAVTSGDGDGEPIVKHDRTGTESK